MPRIAPRSWQDWRANTHPRARRHAVSVALLAVLALLLASCASNAPSPARPASPRAEQVNDLWWILAGLAIFVCLAVFVILIVGSLRVPSDEEQARRHPLGTPLLWVGGITIPAIIFAVVFFLSTKDLVAIAHPAPPQLTIDVTGHQWWWEANYRQQGFITANEIHIPAGQQVKINLTSTDVIHDFWVPQLQGKIDAIPGENNSIYIESGQTGTYQGECLVYCGLQHAHMNFIVVVQTPDQFNAWVAQQKQPAVQPTNPQAMRGAQVFASSSCVYCHAVSGTSANARVGPDLTHFASRQQIGAGVLPNNSAALADWLRDPAASKPGVLMPAQTFSQSDLAALVSYLESLK